MSLIGCHLDAKFVEAIDRARGVKSRSQFLREVLHWYLSTQCGIRLPTAMQHAPDRAGKGGRPRMIMDFEAAKVAEDPVEYKTTPKKPTK